MNEPEGINVVLSFQLWHKTSSIIMLLFGGKQLSLSTSGYCFLK